MSSLKHLSQIATALKVPAGKLSVNIDLLPVRTFNNLSVTGFLNIVFTLVKESSLTIGITAENKDEIYQWLEYALVYINNVESNQSINQVLSELNEVLATKTYLVSDTLTVADIVVYYIIQNTVAKLSYLEKEKYINVSRWFDNVQNIDYIRQNNSVINFNTIYLASVAPAK